MITRYQKYEKLCAEKLIIETEINDLTKRLDELRRKKVVIDNEIRCLNVRI